MTAVLDKKLIMRISGVEQELWKENADRAGLGYHAFVRATMNAACGEVGLIKRLEAAQAFARSLRGKKGGRARKRK